ncbi:hypothetical protein BaRGS_00031075, partial [Batillaria attramentaria]
ADPDREVKGRSATAVARSKRAVACGTYAAEPHKEISTPISCLTPECHSVLIDCRQGLVKFPPLWPTTAGRLSPVKCYPSNYFSPSFCHVVFALKQDIGMRSFVQLWV